MTSMFHCLQATRRGKLPRLGPSQTTKLTSAPSLSVSVTDAPIPSEQYRKRAFPSTAPFLCFSS